MQEFLTNAVPALIISGLGVEIGEIGWWTIAVAIVGNAACAIVGCYLVLRRMSLLGDAISHSVLTAIGVVFLLTGRVAPIPMFIGALLVGMLTAFLTETLHKYGNVPEDSSMGVVFTSLFALGVVIISQFRLDLDADCVLYGNLEFVGLNVFRVGDVFVPKAMPQLLFVLLATVILVAVLWKEFKIASFDPQLASAVGFSAVFIHYLLMALTAAVTIASMESVGAIVVIAMLIVPAATAQLLTDRLGSMMLIAVAVSVVSSFFGYVFAVRFDTNTAGMMAVVAGFIFSTAVMLAPRYGLIAKWIANAQLGLRIVGEDVIATLYRLEERMRDNPALPLPKQSDCTSGFGSDILGKLVFPVLKYHGQIEVSADGTVALTSAGRKKGASLLRSHRLWESYMQQHFELADDHLHEPAHRVEHYIGRDLQDRIARELDAPATDPHGKAIPGADE